MKKTEFLDKLCQGLRFQTDPDEIRKVVAFYDQAIEDRIEDGMGEEEAVAAMGDIYDIVREVRGTWNQAEECPSGGAGASDEAEPGRVSLTYDPAVTGKIDVYDTSGDVTVEPSSDGLIHVEYQVDRAWRYEVTGDSALTVRRVRNGEVREPERLNLNLFGHRLVLTKPDLGGLLSDQLELRLLLPSAAPVALSVNTASGDVDVEAVRLASLTLRLTNGDANLEALSVDGKLSAATTNGDVEMTHVKAAEIAVTTVSGDVSAELIRANAVTVRTTSGDVEMEEADTVERVNVATVSGDMDLQLNIPCPAMDLESVSGDVCLELAGSEALYTVNVRTTSGDVDVEEGAFTGPHQVKIKTISGDIDVSFEG